MNVEEILQWIDDEINTAEEAVEEWKGNDDLSFVIIASIGRIETLKQLKGEILGDDSYN